MAGVRIYSPVGHNGHYVIVDQTRPYTTPFECSGCHNTHVFKTYHIRLDSFGFAIVSREVWARLQAIPGAPFELSNEVEKPPSQIVSPFGDPLQVKVTPHNG